MFLLSTPYLTDVLFVFLDLKYLPKVFFCSLTMFFCFCFQYVRECIALEKIPQFMLLTKESIYATLPECYFQMPSYSQRGNQPPPSPSLQYTFTYSDYWRLQIWSVSFEQRAPIEAFLKKNQTTKPTHPQIYVRKYRLKYRQNKTNNGIVTQMSKV